MRDAESFYAERDSRTIKLVGRSDYRNRRILLTLDDALASTVNGQTMAFTSINLISRFCRRIDIRCPEVLPCIPILSDFRAPSLAEALLHTAGLIDPYGDFRITATDDDGYDVVLAIGQPRLARKPDLAINSDELSSFVAKEEGITVVNARANPLGAACSSILASCEIFKRFVGLEEWFEKMRFNLSDYSVQENYGEEASSKDDDGMLGEVDLGDVQMVGCGALGSGLGFFLSMLPVSGKLMLIDHDVLEVSNLNRYLSFTTRDVGKYKANALADFLANKRLEVKSFVGRYSEYVEAHGAGFPAVVLSLVDKNGPRHEIQMNMPRLILYAATGEWTFTVGRHRAFVDDCHICRFPDPDADGGGECAVATVIQGSQEVDAAVPFVSGLASLILTVELLKMMSRGRTSTKNFLQLDMSLPLRIIRQGQRKRSEGCVCSETWFKATYQRRLQEMKRAIS